MPQGLQAAAVTSPKVSRALEQQSPPDGSPRFTELLPRQPPVPSPVPPPVQSPVPSHDSAEQSSSSVDQPPSRYHQLTTIPPSAKKTYPQKRCRECSFHKRRREVRNHCELCPAQPGLCKGKCFDDYHARVGLATHVITPPVAHRTRARRNRPGNAQPRQRRRGFQGGRDQRGQYTAGHLSHSSSPDYPPPADDPE